MGQTRHPIQLQGRVLAPCDRNSQVVPSSRLEQSSSDILFLDALWIVGAPIPKLESASTTSDGQVCVKMNSLRLHGSQTPG